MSKQSTPPAAPAPEQPAPTATVIAVVPASKVSSQVAAIRASVAEQAKVTTRFDARRFKRKEQR